MPRKSRGKPLVDWYVGQTIRAGDDWGVVKEIRQDSLIVQVGIADEEWTRDIVDERR